MANIFNNDFREFLQALNQQKVNYLLVGGYAVILHGYRRSTGDMDLWIQTTAENYKNLVKACNQFGLPIIDMTEENFLNNNLIEVFTYGRPPVSIDIMKTVKGCNFDEAYTISQVYIEDSLEIRYLHYNSLIQAKKASGRYKDLDDIEKLS